MKKLLPLILCALISACDVSVESGTESMQTFHGAGITFKVPFESNTINHGDFGIKYESNTIKAETNGEALYVNGISYGAVKSGDIVNFKDPSVVLVNGHERSPDTYQIVRTDAGKFCGASL